MTDQSRFAVWWQKESQRHLTKLERDILGALFAAIAIIFAPALWITAA